MDIRVVVAGAGGRMGHRVISQINAAEDMTLSGALERPDHHALGDDAGLQAGVGPLGVFLTGDTVSLEGDVAVSFAIPEASVAHAQLAEEKGMALVIGTTGFSEGSTQNYRILHGKNSLCPLAQHEYRGERCFSAY